VIRHSFDTPLSDEARAFLSQHTGVDYVRFDTSGWLAATGTRDGEVVGVCCFEPKTTFDWHYNAAVTDPRCVTRRLLKALFTAVFTQATRVTALIEPANERAIKNARQLGFQYEGYMRLSVEGKRVSLQDAQLRPTPVQRPHPPIWIGGSGPRRTLPLVARYADVWHTWGTPNSLRDTNARLDELAVEAGRDPKAIMRANSLSLDDLDTARKHAGKWVDAGYGYLICGWPDAGRAQVEAFAREVMPEFAG